MTVSIFIFRNLYFPHSIQIQLFYLDFTGASYRIFICVFHFTLIFLIFLIYLFIYLLFLFFIFNQFSLSFSAYNIFLRLRITYDPGLFFLVNCSTLYSKYRFSPFLRSTFCGRLIIFICLHFFNLFDTHISSFDVILVEAYYHILLCWPLDYFEYLFPFCTSLHRII